MTRSSSAVVLAAAACAGSLLAVPSPAPAQEGRDVVRQAIAQSVVDRLGVPARVTVTGLQTSVRPEGALAASPEPSARTGSASRFVLFAGGARVGTAVATAAVTAVHVRARRAVARDEVITADDVQEVEAPLLDQPMRRMPALADVIGTRARRDIPQGEIVTAAVVEVLPLVKSGDQVTVVIRIGNVEAEGRATASGSGHAGDIIRVVNAGLRKPARARVTGPATVEMIQ